MNRERIPLSVTLKILGRDLGDGRLPDRLQAILPVSRAAMAVGNRENLNGRFLLSIDDCVGKLLENESSRTVLVGGPGLRPARDVFQRVENGGHEPDAGVGTLLAIPVVGSFEFLPCLWVEVIWLSGRHRTAGLQGGVALPRTESSEPCQNQSLRCGA